MSLNMARRAKARMLESNFGQFKEKYAMLSDYVKELILINLGSSIDMQHYK